MAADLLVAPISVGALLLVLSGVGKLRNPEPMAQALYSLGWPHYAIVVRTLGSVEIAAGLGALTIGGVGGLGEAVLYGSFGAVLAVVLLNDMPMSTCGCAGANATPPTWVHALLDLLVAACAVGGAALGTPSIYRIAGDLRYMMPVYVIGVCATAWLAYLIVTHAPRLFAKAYAMSDAEGV
jgi:hypothetical protein